MLVNMRGGAKWLTITAWVKVAVYDVVPNALLSVAGSTKCQRVKSLSECGAAQLGTEEGVRLADLPRVVVYGSL